MISAEHMTYQEIHAVLGCAWLQYEIVWVPSPFAAGEMWRP